MAWQGTIQNLLMVGSTRSNRRDITDSQLCSKTWIRLALERSQKCIPQSSVARCRCQREAISHKFRGALLRVRSKQEATGAVVSLKYWNFRRAASTSQQNQYVVRSNATSKYCSFLVVRWVSTQYSYHLSALPHRNCRQLVDSQCHQLIAWPYATSSRIQEHHPLACSDSDHVWLGAVPASFAMSCSFKWSLFTARSSILSSIICVLCCRSCHWSSSVLWHQNGRCSDNFVGLDIFGQGNAVDVHKVVEYNAGSESIRSSVSFVCSALFGGRKPRKVNKFVGLRSLPLELLFLAFWNHRRQRCFGSSFKLCRETLVQDIIVKVKNHHSERKKRQKRQNGGSHGRPNIGK